MEKQKEIQLEYLYQLKTPLLPAIGDIRLMYTYTEAKEKNQKPKLVFHVLECIKVCEHSATYEFLEENQNGKTRQIVVPFESIDNFGYSNTNNMIKDFINGLMLKMIKSSNSSDFSTSFSPNNDFVEYSKNLQDIFILYRLALKEANRVNAILLKKSN